MVTEAVLDQFAYRWFPAPLLGLGRAMAASTLHPNCWKTHKVAVPGPVARRILLRATGLMIRLGQLAAPDPDKTYYEELTAATRDQRTSRSRRIREFDEEFSRDQTSAGSMMWSSTLNRLYFAHPPPSLGAIS